MKKTNISIVNEKYYSTTLSNGLEILYHSRNHSFKLISININCGGRNVNCFNFETQRIEEIPSGCAHFLEHILFDKKYNGKDIISAMEECYCSANGQTSMGNTEFFFKTQDDVYEPLLMLLDFVHNLFITDQMIKSERKIILEEKNEYSDNIHRDLYEKLNKNLFNNRGLKVPVIGYDEDIRNITKKNVINFHKTYYKPENMKLLVEGNVNIHKVIRTVKKFYKQNKVETQQNIDKPQIKETVRVIKKQELVKMKIDTNIVKIAIKFVINSTDPEEQLVEKVIIRQILRQNFDSNEEFYKTCFKDDIFQSLYFESSETDDLIVCYILLETEKVDEIIKKVKEKLKNLIFKKDEFELRKKSIMGYQIGIYDNFFPFVNSVTEDLQDGEKFLPNYLEIIRGVTYEDIVKYMKTMDTSNFSIIIAEKI